MSNINRQYGWDMEDIGYSKLEDFNSKLKIESLGRTPKNHPSGDASGYTLNGEVNIEIKVRELTFDENTLTFTGNTGTKEYTGNTLYIELHKAGDMLLDYVCDDKIPIYLNFLGDYAIVFNLSKLSKRPNTVTKTIWSNLYKSYENARRIELPIADAFIYKREDNGWRTVRTYGGQ